MKKGAADSLDYQIGWNPSQLYIGIISYAMKSGARIPIKQPVLNGRKGLLLVAHWYFWVFIYISKIPLKQLYDLSLMASQPAPQWFPLCYKALLLNPYFWGGVG